VATSHAGPRSRLTTSAPSPSPLAIRWNRWLLNAHDPPIARPTEVRVEAHLRFTTRWVVNSLWCFGSRPFATQWLANFAESRIP
jgi:hypothetical protein